MIYSPSNRRQFLGGAAALATGAALPARAAEDTLQSVYEGAKKEGKVVFWSSNDVAVSQASAKRFAEKFPGIAVEAYKIEPGPAIERIIGETTANRLSADVVDSPISYTKLLFDRDLAISYPWEKVFGLDKDSILFDGRALYCYNLDVPIAFNTQMAKASDFKSWDDLLDPKWSGKILLEARGIEFPLLALAWGEEKAYAYLQKLLANKPIIIKGGTPTIEALAGGQGAVALGTYGGRVPGRGRAGRMGARRAGARDDLRSDGAERRAASQRGAALDLVDNHQGASGGALQASPLRSIDRPQPVAAGPDDEGRRPSGGYRVAGHGPDATPAGQGRRHDQRPEITRGAAAACGRGMALLSSVK